MSSENRKIYRLSWRRNRRINHAIHMAAVTQIRHRHIDGRAYYDKKVAEGKTHKEALRCLKRRISDAIFARLQADARRTAPAARAGWATGERLCRQRGRLSPRKPALRTSHSLARYDPTAPHPAPANRAAKADIQERSPKSLTAAKRTRSARPPTPGGVTVDGPRAG
jgi:transposase